MHPGNLLCGHDTVGTPAHDLTLSQDRARRNRGLGPQARRQAPDSYEGFGDTALAVKTADSVDEIKNRRVDYVISDGPPVYSAAFKPAGSGSHEPTTPVFWAAR